MSRKSKPLIDFSAGGTFEQVIAAAQGSRLRIELESGMRMIRTGNRNDLKATCQGRLFTKRSSPSGASMFVPLCMPMVGETWAEILNPLGALLDQENWSDIHGAR